MLPCGDSAQPYQTWNLNGSFFAGTPNASTGILLPARKYASTCHHSLIHLLTDDDEIQTPIRRGRSTAGRMANAKKRTNSRREIRSWFTRLAPASTSVWVYFTRFFVVSTVARTGHSLRPARRWCFLTWQIACVLIQGECTGHLNCQFLLKGKQIVNYQGDCVASVPYTAPPPKPAVRFSTDFGPISDGFCGFFDGVFD